MLLVNKIITAAKYGFRCVSQQLLHRQRGYQLLHRQRGYQLLHRQRGYHLLYRQYPICHALVLRVHTTYTHPHKRHIAHDRLGDVFAATPELVSQASSAEGSWEGIVKACGREHVVYGASGGTLFKTAAFLVRPFHNCISSLFSTTSALKEWQCGVQHTCGDQPDQRRS
jgi:hypothetical protein